MRHPEASPALLKPETLRSQVEKYLREAIVNGRFRPGERLVERELCDMLAISRPSLREALRRLEAEKLIRIVPHRGPVVASISMAEAKELYAVRALLEGYAAQGFAEHADAAAIDRLQAAVHQLHAFTGADDREALLVAKAEFYEVILGGCGNALVAEILRGLLSRVTLLRSTSFSRPDRLAESLAEIDHLVECIKARDASAAREAARQHIQNAEKAALAVIMQQSPSAPPTDKGARDESGTVR